MVSKTEKIDFDQFLKNNHMVYNFKPDINNRRTVNFLGNFIANDNKYGDVLIPFADKRAMVIGLGTVGTALVDDLLQFGVSKFVLIDNDCMEESNISHQRNFSSYDVGKKKIEVISDRICSVVEKSDVQSLSVFVEDIKDLEFLFNEKNIDVVFWCFDNYKTNLLEDMYDYSKTKNIPVYLSGYFTGGAVRAMRLTQEVIRDSIQFEKEHKFIISENSGIGVLGDLSAALMIRLWIQSIYLELDLGVSKLEYDLMHPQKTISSSQLNISSQLERYSDACNNEKAYLNKNVIFPYILMMYTRYIIGESGFFSELEKIDLDMGFGFLDEEDRKENEYLCILEGLKVNYDTKEISVLDFAKLALKDTNVPRDKFDEVNKKIISIAPIAVEALKQKKKKYFGLYERMWGSKRDLKYILQDLAKDIGRKLYDNKLDYMEYKPYDKESYDKSVEDELKIIGRIDDSNKYTDFMGFIDYAQEHNFLHIVEDGDNSVNIFNPRYAMSDIVVGRGESWQNVFSIAHEIGHGFYDSLLPKNEQEMDVLLSEVLSTLTEYQIMKILIKQFSMDAVIETIKYKIQSVFIGMFSLDLYEENVLRLNELNLDNIKQTRRTLVHSFMPTDFEIKNERYSENNIFLNTELIFQKREVYLYPEAYLFAFDLGYRIERDNLVQKHLIDYIKKANKMHRINIYDFYDKEFGVDINYEAYNQMKEKVLVFIDDNLSGGKDGKSFKAQ